MSRSAFGQRWGAGRSSEGALHSVFSLPATRATPRQAVPARQIIFECSKPGDRALATILISSHTDQGRSKCHKQHEHHDGNHDADCERVVTDAIIDVKRQSGARIITNAATSRPNKPSLFAALSSAACARSYANTLTCSTRSVLADITGIEERRP